MKVFVLVGLCLFITSCNTFVVHQDRVAIKIEKKGTFVTVSEFMQLADGESVKYSNKYRLEPHYYIPPNYIIKIKNKIRLRTEEDDKKDKE